jgi:hypothetical protein
MTEDQWERLSFGEKFALLEQALKKVPKLASLSDSEHDEVSAVALGLLDIEETLESLQPRLRRVSGVESMTIEEIEDWLTEIGEDLQHVLYHVRDMKLYEFL